MSIWISEFNGDFTQGKHNKKRNFIIEPRLFRDARGYMV